MPACEQQQACISFNVEQAVIRQPCTDVQQGQGNMAPSIPSCLWCTCLIRLSMPALEPCTQLYTRIVCSFPLHCESLALAQRFHYGF
jgi:hypothetical protein